MAKRSNVNSKFWFVAQHHELIGNADSEYHALNFLIGKQEARALIRNSSVLGLDGLQVTLDVDSRMTFFAFFAGEGALHKAKCAVELYIDNLCSALGMDASKLLNA